jgi:pimeloyl-ACP methyl ester carboxylesterase
VPSPRNALRTSRGAEVDTSERVFRSSDGLRLVAHAEGNPDGSPVILLHGGGQTRHAWQETALALAGAGFYALALDQRGHGQSDWSEEARYDLDSFAADLELVARELPARPAVVGASLGGLAGLLAEGSARSPLLSALVLVDVAPRMELAGVRRIVTFMKAHPDGFESLEQAQDAISAYLPHRPRPKDPSGLAKNLRQSADGRFRWHWDPRFVTRDHGLTPEEFQAKLHGCSRNLRIPTLLVRGRQSDVLSEAGSREFLELVPHAEYADVADAAHMVAGDRNDRFTEVVLQFLLRVR